MLIAKLILLLSTSAFAQSKYFVVQNVAADRTRVYERCTTSSNCAHKMILEAKSLFGMPKDNDAGGGNKFHLRTWLGTFKIQSWRKFYADGRGKHAPWWGDGFPAPPRKGAGILTWISPRYMPSGYNHEEGLRGPFGWYAAILDPVPDGQWMHGTFGWGADGDKFLSNLMTESGGGYLNFSSGCARVENRAIAWMQHHLPKGTEVYRVYAIENVADVNLQRYAAVKKKGIDWDWILTDEKSGSSDAGEVKSRDSSEFSIIEQGRFTLDQYPNPVAIKRGGTSGRSISERNAQKDFMIGNNYLLPKDEFQGVFLIDEGRFKDYRHPSRLTAHSSKEIPADLKVQF
jgi:hypothetical protein